MLDYEVNEKELNRLNSSSATCHLSEIENFIYGASTTRFWMLRKHIISLCDQEKVGYNMPFFSWECITL